jgi:hypothetical protein
LAEPKKYVEVENATSLFKFWAEEEEEYGRNVCIDTGECQLMFRLYMAGLDSMIAFFKMGKIKFENDQNEKCENSK